MDFSSLEIANKLTKKLQPLSSLLIEDSDLASYLSFLYRTLSLSIVSFSGSHASAFDVTSWNAEMNSISVGLGYSFARRGLAYNVVSARDDVSVGADWNTGKSTPRVHMGIPAD
jgi:hypothetical protein